MFDGDLWMLASDAVAMAESAYKKGQTDEREACAELASTLYGRAAADEIAFSIRARGRE
jgi:hypothetical protein